MQKIFYSWQRDLPNKTNRGLIGDALELAVKELHRDPEIEIEPVIDRDVAGTPGAPAIAHTIFAKIKEAEVFVGDVSIINGGATAKPTPNPNVLVELGYAIGVLGFERIIMVLNAAYGPPESLPFDLRQRTRSSTRCPKRPRSARRYGGTWRNAWRKLFARSSPCGTQSSLA